MTLLPGHPKSYSATVWPSGGTMVLVLKNSLRLHWMSGKSMGNGVLLCMVEWARHLLLVDWQSLFPMYVCMYVCIYPNVHKCSYLYQYIYVSICMYVCMNLSLYLSIYLSGCKYLFIRINPVGWGCKIHRLHLCRRVRPTPLNRYPGHITKPHLIVRLQPQSFGKWGVLLHCHYSQFHSDWC